MRIKSIQLKNGYKRFLDLTIDLGASPRKIIALVGPNGSGKSSVFDGMLYFQTQWRQVGALGASWEYHSMDGNPAFQRDALSNVIINFDSGTGTDVMTKRGATGSESTVLAFRSSYRYSDELNVKQQEALQDIKENRIGAGATYMIDDKIKVNYQRVHVLMERLFKKAGSVQTYTQVKEEVLGTLNKTVKAVLNLTLCDHGSISDGRGMFYFMKADQTKEFSFNVLSSGEKEVIDIILDIFLKKDDYKETIYIIDEPELHLNTAIQRKLLNEITAMIPDTSQLWIATHSIGFLNAIKQDHVNDASVIWFGGDNSQPGTVLRPMEKTRANWKTLFQTALEDLTGLLAPEVIVYCEGKSEPSVSGEEKGFDARIYNLIFATERPEVLFVSSGGATQPQQYSEIALKVLGKAFEDVQLLLLLDRDIDPDGNITTEQMRLAWLAKESKSRRMLQRREIENYLLDWHIVKKTFPICDESSYQGLIKDIVNDDVKSCCSDIKKICGKEQMNKEEFLFELARAITPDTGAYIELSKVIFIENLATAA